uniref:Uncharacterized protein n=1 Tax=Romanomermis culicivorax TaxID=13658 RepID=A0A915KUE2_ROMCU
MMDAAKTKKIYRYGSKFLGKSLCQKLLEISFYRQFVAGRRFEELEQISNHLFQSGRIKTMLCPPMEEWSTETQNEFQAKATVNANRYMEYLDIARKLRRTHVENETVLQLKPSSIFPTAVLVS